MAGVHSKLGASALDRWGNCPGSVTLLERVPAENRSSIYADEGTAAHGLAERHVAAKHLDPGRMPMPLEKLHGYYIDTEGALFPPTHDLTDHILPFFMIDEEMISAVDLYEQTISKLLRELGYGKPGSRVVLGLEVKFGLAYIDPEMFGTTDSVIYAPGGEMHIVDFKYGAGKVVEVDRNPQLLYYALGAIRHYCWDEAFAEYVDLPSKVTLHICQPRARHKRGTVRSWSCTTEEVIKDFGLDLIGKVRDARDPTAKLAVGDWCRWCAAKAHCPEQLNFVKRQLRNDFADLEIEAQSPREVTKEAKKRAEGLVPTTADELAEVMKCLPLIEEFCKAVAARTLNEMQAGIHVDGQKLVDKRAFRKYKDEREAAKAFTTYLDEDQIYEERKIKSPAQIEALLPKKSDKGNANGKAAHALLEELTIKESSGLTIAPDWDPRDAVRPEISKAVDDLIDIDGIIL